jgi:hypothetical protein
LWCIPPSQRQGPGQEKGVRRHARADHDRPAPVSRAWASKASDPSVFGAASIKGRATPDRAPSEVLSLTCRRIRRGGGEDSLRSR